MQFNKRDNYDREKMVELLFSKKKKTDSPVVLMHYEGLRGFS